MTNYKSLIIDPALCTGCEQCEIACSYSHEKSFNTATSRINIFEYEHGAKMVPYACTQCAEAWCAKSCPVEALTRNQKTGAIDLDEARCIGCKVCTIACPYGTINYHQDLKKIAKCDLCGGDPKCAEACPTGAIVFDVADAARAQVIA